MEDLRQNLNLLSLEYTSIDHLVFQLVRIPGEIWPPLDRTLLAQFRQRAIKVIETIPNRPRGLIVRRSLLEEAVPSDKCIQMLLWLSTVRLEEAFPPKAEYQLAHLVAKHAQIETAGRAWLKQLQAHKDALQCECSFNLDEVHELEELVTFINEEMAGWSALSLLTEDIDPMELTTAMEKTKLKCGELLSLQGVDEEVEQLQVRKGELESQIERYKQEIK